MSKNDVKEAFNIGRGGWVLLRVDQFPGLLIYARMEETTPGRLDIGELYVDGPLDPATVRNLPIRFITVMANSPAASKAIRGRMASGNGRVGPLLSIAASHFSDTDHEIMQAEGWVGDMMKSQFPDSGVKPAERKQLPTVPSGGLEKVGPKLTVPDVFRFPDEFYQEVAAVYRSQLAEGNGRPAVTIAEASNVPVTTVHHWIKETRKRGFLPPGRVGSAG